MAYLINISPEIVVFDMENEDILSDSLEFLGGKPVIDDSNIRYGPLILTLAPKVRVEFSYTWDQPLIFSYLGRQSAQSCHLI